MFRESLEVTLAPVYDVVPGASTLVEADAAFRRGGIDVALVDISWGAEGHVVPYLRRWRQYHPDCHIIIQTAMDEWFLGQAMLQDGARGFIGKRSSYTEVIEAIAAVARGETYIGRDIKRPLPRPEGSPQRQVSDVPRRVFEYLALGWSRKLIAKGLHIDVRTVDYHIGNLRKAFGIKRWQQPNWSELYARSRQA